MVIVGGTRVHNHLVEDVDIAEQFVVVCLLMLLLRLLLLLLLLLLNCRR